MDHGHFSTFLSQLVQRDMIEGGIKNKDDQGLFPFVYVRNSKGHSRFDAANKEESHSVLSETEAAVSHTEYENKVSLIYINNLCRSRPEAQLCFGLSRFTECVCVDTSLS